MHYIQGGNLASAELLLKQIIKVRPNHSEALRLSAVISAQQGNGELAMGKIEKAILADRKNSNAYSNKGNIELSLGKPLEAIESYRVAIHLSPKNAEAHNNLGNAYQEISEHEEAIKHYSRALSITPSNHEFLCNLGNAYWKLGDIKTARSHYEAVISLSPDHFESIYNLAHLDLLEFNFERGWRRYESRWLTQGGDQSAPLVTKKPIWDGSSKSGRLLIWAEQGLGDQILYASMFHELEKYSQQKIISVDKKLMSIFERSFPDFKIVDRAVTLPEEAYDEHFPMGSLGYLFRPALEVFGKNTPHLIENKLLIEKYKVKSKSESEYLCGLSWKSGRSKFGVNKSLPLIQLAPILKIEKIKFINLQYGEVDQELSSVARETGITIEDFSNIDLFEDIEGALAVLSLCDIVVTTSNTTAHLAGALGKETLLLMSTGHSKFWYWHDVDGISLWYPTIRIFKQERPGDWSKPIQALKEYLENRFGV